MTLTQRLYKELPYRDSLLALARKRCPQYAEDIVQDAYMRAWQADERYTFEGSEEDLMRWLHALVRWTSLDYLRRERSLYQAKLEVKHNVKTTTTQPTAELEVAQLLETLDPEQACALGYVVLEDMTYREAAQAMGRTKTAVTRLVKEAMNSLRGAANGKSK